MPRVSVIIPTFNRSKFIAESVESVLNQTYRDYEIIIVDDGSTDNTRDILEKYKGKINYIYQENRGVCAARNNGILNSSGEYLSFLDSDDIYLPNKLELQINFLNSRPDVDIVYSWCDYIDENDKALPIKSREIYKHGTLLKEMILREVYIAIHAFLIPRRCFNNIGLFDESLTGEEIQDILLRLAIQKYRFSCIPKSLVKYRIHQNSIEGNALIRPKNMVAVLDKTFRNELLPEDIKPLKNKAYYRALNECAWHFLQRDDRENGLKYLSESINYCPYILSDYNTFVQWANNLMPFTKRSNAELYKNINQISDNVFSILKELFEIENLSDGIVKMKGEAYANANIAIGILGYLARDINLSRSNFLEAFKTKPILIFKPTIAYTFFKCLLGKRLINKIARSK